VDAGLSSAHHTEDQLAEVLRQAEAPEGLPLLRRIANVGDAVCAGWANQVLQLLEKSPH
jgi:hypothetical protein